jgi:hypothetical protein
MWGKKGLKGFFGFKIAERTRIWGRWNRIEQNVEESEELLTTLKVGKGE